MKKNKKFWKKLKRILLSLSARNEGFIAGRHHGYETGDNRAKILKKQENALNDAYWGKR